MNSGRVRARRIDVAVSLIQFSSMSSTKKTARRQLVREELLTKAAEVFERQGFTQTRIEDIASALELKRSAVYYYFETKNDVLRALVEEFCEIKAQEHEDSIKDHGLTASQKLRILLSTSIRIRTAGGARVRALDSIWTEMPEDIREMFEAARRRILALHVAVVKEGMEAGEFRRVDPRLAALAVLGIVNWTSWWYTPNGRDRVEDLQDELVTIALSGLQLVTRESGSARSPREIIESIERDLAALKNLSRG